MLTKNVFKSTRTLLLGLVLVSSMAVSACFVTPSVSTSISVSSSSSESTSVSTSVSSVSSISVITAQDLADDAAGSLLLSGITGVTADMSLPSAGKNAASITWASENTSVISIATATNGVGVWVATVIRPMSDEGGTNVTVKLTATVSVTLEGVTATQTKEFSVFVLAIPASEVMTITQANAAADGTKIKIAEATVVHIQNDGFHIWDGVDTLFVYLGAAPTVAVNDVVQVIGEMDIYYGLPELAKGPAVTKLADKTPVALPVAAVKTIAAINDEVSATTGTYGDLVKITGVVTWDAATSLLKIYDGEEYLVVYAGGSSTVSTAAVTYLKDNFAGKKVSFDVWIKDYHSSGYWRVLTDADTAEEVTVVPLTDAEKVEIAKTYLTGLIPLEVFSDLALPTTYSVDGTAVTIAWVSDTTGTLGNDGKITFPDSGSVSVKLTATMTLNSEQLVKEFTVSVGQPVISTIAAAVAAPIGSNVAVQALVVGSNTESLYLKDATGFILVYKKSLSQLGVAIGDEVIVYGPTAIYNGTPQLTSTLRLVKKISTGNALNLTPRVVTAAELRAIKDYTSPEFVDLIGDYVQMEVKIVVSGSYINFSGISETTEKPFETYKMDSTSAAYATLKEYNGYTVKLNGFFYGFSYVTSGTTTVDATGTYRFIFESFEGSPVLPNVETPTNIQVNGTVVTWDVPTGAGSYSVNVYSADVLVKTIAVSSATIDLNDQGLVTGSYAVKIVSIPVSGYLSTGTASEKTSIIDIVQTGPTYNSVYTTNFQETGYTTSTTYNNQTPVFNGPTNFKWGILSGTVSTTAPIEGLNSIQMRYYTTAASTYPEAYTDFDVSNVDKIEFQAKSYTNPFSVVVSISTDGGVTWKESQTFTVTTTAGTYTYLVSEASGSGNLRVKIAIANTLTAADRLTIDNVAFYSAS